MSIDAYFSDGTALRNYSNVVDQYGARTGPAYRGGVSTNQWYCFDVDLAPVVGKMVLHWYLAYDNRFIGTTGQFRAYFDSVKVVWPGGKP